MTSIAIIFYLMARIPSANKAVSVHVRKSLDNKVSSVRLVGPDESTRCEFFT